MTNSECAIFGLSDDDIAARLIHSYTTRPHVLFRGNYNVLIFFYTSYKLVLVHYCCYGRLCVRADINPLYKLREKFCAVCARRQQKLWGTSVNIPTVLESRILYIVIKSYVHKQNTFGDKTAGVSLLCVAQHNIYSYIAWKLIYFGQNAVFGLNDTIHTVPRKIAKCISRRVPPSRPDWKRVLLSGSVPKVPRYIIVCSRALFEWDVQDNIKRRGIIL